jgi:LacI family transcriptional regulator
VISALSTDNPPRNVTRNDVARLAGVSGGTVSLVLNRVPNKISEKTRRAVIDAAKQLSYIPNSSARSLISGRSYNIGVVFYDIDYITHPFFARTVPGVSQVANEHRYGISFLNTRPPIGDTPNNFYFMDKVIAREVDGLIFQDDFVAVDLLKQLSKMQFPYVLINREIPMPTARSVLVDYNGTMTDSVNYLHGLGHQHIAFVTLKDLRGLRDSKRVVAAFRRAVKSPRTPTVHSCVFDLNLVHKPRYAGCYDMLDEDFWDAAAIEVGEHFKAHPKVTALICRHDGIARIMNVVLSKLGLVIPRDISIMGVNNDPACVVMNPPLTTHEIPSHDLGAIAAEMLFDMMGVVDDRSDQPVARDNKLYLRTRLLLRNSCAPPRNRAGTRLKQ